MITILSTVISIIAFRFRRRACLELELIGLRHQVSILRRQHPGRIRLFSTDRLLWVWLYRVWPQILTTRAGFGVKIAAFPSSVLTHNGAQNFHSFRTDSQTSAMYGPPMNSAAIICSPIPKYIF
jgi:hypothetical protein